MKKSLELTGINETIYVEFEKCNHLIFFIINFQKLVVKPDQLIKRRGKLGLIKVNVNLQEAKKWIDERMGKDIQVSLCYTVQILGKSPVADCDIFPCDHLHFIQVSPLAIYDKPLENLLLLIETFFIVILSTLRIHASP